VLLQATSLDLIVPTSKKRERNAEKRKRREGKGGRVSPPIVSK